MQVIRVILVLPLFVDQVRNEAEIIKENATKGIKRKMWRRNKKVK
jgi:hypothetical protein